MCILGNGEMTKRMVMENTHNIQDRYMKEAGKMTNKVDLAKRSGITKKVEDFIKVILLMANEKDKGLYL